MENHPSRNRKRNSYRPCLLFESAVSPFFLQVSLQVNGEHKCGGVLYTSSTVITTARCCRKVLANGSFVTESPDNKQQF
jgi:hypothetical protein